MRNDRSTNQGEEIHITACSKFLWCGNLEEKCKRRLTVVKESSGILSSRLSSLFCLRVWGCVKLCMWQSNKLLLCNQPAHLKPIHPRSPAVFLPRSLIHSSTSYCCLPVQIITCHLNCQLSSPDRHHAPDLPFSFCFLPVFTPACLPQPSLSASS